MADFPTSLFDYEALGDNNGRWYNVTGQELNAYETMEGGYLRTNLLGLQAGNLTSLHDPLRMHPALQSQLADKEGLLRPLTDYPPLHLLPFATPPFLPHHLDPRLPFNPSAFHPLHKIGQPPSSSNSIQSSITSSLPCSAFVPMPSKVAKLQADSSPITSSGLFSHGNILSGIEQRHPFMNGASPPSMRTTVLEDRRDSPSPRGSNGSRESPGHIRESSTPTSPDDSKVRKSLPPGDPWCPVCGISLRPCEIGPHLNVELEKLSRLVTHRQPSQEPNTSSSTGITSISSGTSQSPNISPFVRGRDSGWDTFQRVKANRQIRLRTKKRKIGRDDAFCPLCSDRINANSQEEFQSHMEQCIRRAQLFGILQHNVIEEEDIDVEGDSYAEDDWLARRRGSTAAMLRAQQLQAKESEMESSSEKEVTSATPEKGANSCDTASPDAVNSTKEESKQSDALEKELEGLRDKVKHLENTTKTKYMCNACQGDFDRPAMSLKCFHVCCQGCWPSSLNKPECPVCSESYSSEDIKQIHL